MKKRFDQLDKEKKDNVINLIQRRNNRGRKKLFHSDNIIIINNIDVSYLSLLPALRESFQDALLSITSSMRNQKSRNGFVAVLRTGFFKFLLENGYDKIALSDLDTAFINSFITWLTLLADKVTTKRLKLCVLRRIIKAISIDPKWSHVLRKDVRVKDNPWPAADRHIKPVKLVHQTDFIAFYKAAVKEVERTIVQIEPMIDQLVVRDKLTFADLNFRSSDDCLAYLAQDLELAIAGKEAIIAHKARLWTTIHNHGGLLKFTQYLFPSPRLLVPFVILLAIHTRYNPDVVLSSNLDDFSEEEVLGKPMLKATSYKARSRKQQIVYLPIDDSFDNPNRIICFLKKWTHSVRYLAPLEHQRRLLLFVPQQSTKVVKGFGIASTGISGDMNWSHNLKTFCKSNNLRYMPLRNLRLTAIDIGHELSGGDLRLTQTLGNHASPQVTNDHYKSDGARERNFERLAEIMQGRSRYIETEGLIDIRGIPLYGDIGAATPGWSCLDPYASPFWSKNRLCSAYGYCPICPLGAIDLASPYACAQAHNLLASVRNARTIMAPQAWLSRMGPVQEALMSRWLPAFSTEVINKAKLIELQPLPIPE